MPIETIPVRYMGTTNNSVNLLRILRNRGVHIFNFVIILYLNLEYSQVEGCNMKKCIAICTIMICCVSLYAQAQSKSIFYIPTETELQYFMNLYAKLKHIENNTAVDELEELYQVFESEKYYETYQSLLFESYLLATRNQSVKNIMLNFFQRKKIHTDFAETLRRLYTSKIEIDTTNKRKNYVRYNYNNTLFDENINFFNMNEVLTFNDTLGLMLFDNDWLQVNIDIQQNNTQDFSLIYGGGSHSLKISLKKLENIDFETFKKKEINGASSYKDKSLKYQTFELPQEGILLRSGADHIAMALGNGVDTAFKNVENYSSIIFLYSNKHKAGYLIHYFMNISSNNNNYSIRDRLFNHIVFQSLLTFING